MSDDVNCSWSILLQEFMEQYIPKWVLPPSKNLPWMNKNLRQAMRRRTVYKYGKCTGNYSKFIIVCNKFVAQMRKAKKDYLARLNPRNPKMFWKTVKHLNKTTCSVPTLSCNGVEASSDKDKANLLNSFFSTCFNTSYPPLSSSDSNPAGADEYPQEPLCATEEVEHSFQLWTNLKLWPGWSFSHNAEVHCHQHCPICYTVI